MRSNYKLTRKEMQHIAEIAIIIRGNNFKLVEGINYRDNNIESFVLNLIKDIKEGNLVKTNTLKTKRRKIQPVGSQIKIDKITNALAIYIQEHFSDKI